MNSPKLRTHAIAMIGSGKLQPDDLKLVVALLQSGDVKPWEAAVLSYGRGLDHLSSVEFMPLLDELINHGALGLWSALDVIFMYLHPGKAPDRPLEKKLKEILISDELFKGPVRHAMNGHHLEETVALLARHKMLDGRYVRALARQMLTLADVKKSTKFSFMELDEAVRKALSILLPLFPNEVWAGIAPRLIATRSRSDYWLEQLLETNAEDNIGAGPLFALPPNVYLDWVRANAAVRAAIIIRWLPIACRNKSGVLAWHPALQGSTVAEFGAHEAVLNETARRMHPRGWWGSLVPFLRPWLPLLRGWLTHPIPQVRTWAQHQTRHLDGQLIVFHRKRDEERDV